MTLTTSWFDRNESLEQIICQVEVQRFVVKSSKARFLLDENCSTTFRRKSQDESQKSLCLKAILGSVESILAQFEHHF